MRTFRFQPQDHNGPVDKIGFGTVEPGVEYATATAEQGRILAADPDFQEVKENSSRRRATPEDLERPAPSIDTVERPSVVQAPPSPEIAQAASTGLIDTKEKSS